MTPEMIAHYLDVFNLSNALQGAFIAILVILVVAFAIRTLGGH